MPTIDRLDSGKTGSTRRDGCTREGHILAVGDSGDRERTQRPRPAPPSLRCGFEQQSGDAGALMPLSDVLSQSGVEKQPS